MKKTYEMQNNPEFPHIENNIQHPELHHKYLEEECLIPEYNPNFNVNIIYITNSFYIIGFDRKHQHK